MTKSQRIFFPPFFYVHDTCTSTEKENYEKKEKKETHWVLDPQISLFDVSSLQCQPGPIVVTDRILIENLYRLFLQILICERKSFLLPVKKKKKKWRDFLMFLNNQLGSILRPLVLKRNERGFIWRTQWAILPKTIMVHVFFLFSFHLHKLHSFDSVHKQINGCLLCRRPSLNRVTAAEHSS